MPSKTLPLMHQWDAGSYELSFGPEYRSQPLAAMLFDVVVTVF